jgi:hypothetical protein
MWNCKKCNEEVEDQFEICWNCSHDKSGNIVINKGEDKEINIYETLENQRKAQPKVIKHANEYGIAGFVFSSILMFNDGILKFYVTPQMFNSMGFTEAYSGLIISFLIITISISISIKGCMKNGEIFQKGLANLGLILNIILVLLMVIRFYQGYFGDGVENDLNFNFEGLI